MCRKTIIDTKRHDMKEGGHRRKSAIGMTGAPHQSHPFHYVTSVRDYLLIEHHSHTSVFFAQVSWTLIHSFPQGNIHIETFQLIVRNYGKQSQFLQLHIYNL